MLRGLAIGLSRQLASRAPAWQQVAQRAASSAITGAPKVISVAQAAGSVLGRGAIAGGQLPGGLRDCLRQPAAGRTAVLGLRHYSLQQGLQEATQRVKTALEAPARAVQNVRVTAAHTSAALYARMPRQVKQWVDAAQTPGSLNRVLTLQLEAFWQQHGRTVMVLGALAAAYVVWRVLYAAASLVVDLSDKSAMFGFLGLASSTLVGCYLYMRRRYCVDPAAVYRLAMLRLNTDPGILEVMGAPITGSNLRATVTTGGGLRFRGLRPRVQAKRLQMIFPLKGSERRGLVSLEAKKRRGRYTFKLLAVDVPSAVGGEQRIFLCGDESVYGRTSVLGELRDPFTRALSLQEVYDQEDEADAAEDLEEAKAERAKRIAERLERAPKTLDEGGGMFFYERAWFAVRGLVNRATAALKPSAA